MLAPSSIIGTVVGLILLAAPVPAYPWVDGVIMDAACQEITLTLQSKPSGVLREPMTGGVMTQTRDMGEGSMWTRVASSPMVVAPTRTLRPVVPSTGAATVPERSYLTADGCPRGLK